MEYIRSLGRYRLFRYRPNEPIEACLHLTKLIDNFNDTIGVSFFNRAHSYRNPYFLFGIFCQVLYIVSVLLSTYWFRHEHTKVIHCLATFGFGLQSVMKVYSYIGTRKYVHELYQMNVEYNQDMQRFSDRVRRALCENASLSYVLIKGTIMVYSFLTAVTLLIPLISSILLSFRILPFGFSLPLLINIQHTWTGYLGNYAFQLICTFYYWQITVGSDITTIYNLLAAYGQLDVLAVLIDECNDMLDRQAPSEAIRAKLVQIIALHQHHRHYLQKLVDFLNPYHFVVVGSVVPTMTICVVGFVLLKFYPALTVMFLGSIEIFYICFLGTGLELKTDALTKKVSAIHWDKLSIRDMKHMQLMLALAQQPKVLLMATTPINVTAFLQIHKFIYSLIMMLVNTKE